MTRSLLEAPSIQEASCLIQWPRETHGFSQELHALEIMISLSKLLGFGRFGQFAATLEDLWRHPERGPIYQEFHDSLNELRAKGLESHEALHQTISDTKAKKKFEKEYEALEKKVADLQAKLTIERL